MSVTLLVRHPSTGSLLVNFDQSVFQLLDEAVHLQRMGLDIPLLAMRLVERRKTIITNYNNVKVCVYICIHTHVYTCDYPVCMYVCIYIRMYGTCHKYLNFSTEIRGLPSRNSVNVHKIFRRASAPALQTGRGNVPNAEHFPRNTVVSRRQRDRFHRLSESGLATRD